MTNENSEKDYEVENEHMVVGFPRQGRRQKIIVEEVLSFQGEAISFPSRHFCSQNLPNTQKVCVERHLIHFHTSVF